MVPVAKLMLVAIKLVLEEREAKKKVEVALVANILVAEIEVALRSERVVVAKVEVPEMVRMFDTRLWVLRLVEVALVEVLLVLVRLVTVALVAKRSEIVRVRRFRTSAVSLPM